MLHSFSLFRIANNKKYLGWRNYTKFLQKYHVMAIKQHLGKHVLHLQYIQEKILQ